MFKKDPPTNDLLVNFSRVVQAVENTMDGTSGALYTIFLNSLAGTLREEDTGSETQASPKLWAKALSKSVEALEQYTPAKVGDRTLMDALIPFVEELQKSGDVAKAAEAAKKGSQGTKGMKASLGRTVYVGGDGWQDTPDPGAHGLSAFLSGVAKGL
jgi:dihydroxyacetone kinase